MIRALLAVAVTLVLVGCDRAIAANPETEAVSITADDARLSPEAGELKHVPVAALKPTVPRGEVSGTVFWLGPIPEHGADRPLHFGDPHLRDWVGARNANYRVLEDVLISATPLKKAAAVNPVELSGGPATGTMTCWSLHCPQYVTLATGDRLELYNFTDEGVLWNIVKDGRVHLSVAIDAARTDPPAILDISGLNPGLYEVVAPTTNERRGWLYRPAGDEVVVGPTTGNCRYSITLTPGKYKIRAWHPHLSKVERIVTIRASTRTLFNPIFSTKDLVY